jgi:ABC-type transporter Mla MlaB component
MLKIEKTAETNSRVTYSLSGRVSSDHLPPLTALVRKSLDTGKKVTLDLEAVGLVDRETVKFLACGEGRGVKLLHCPVYLREWLRCEGREEA